MGKTDVDIRSKDTPSNNTMDRPKNTDFRETVVYKAIKPLYFWFRITGSMNHYYQEVENGEEPGRKVKCHPNLWRVYHGVVLLCDALELCRALSEFFLEFEARKLWHHLMSLSFGLEILLIHSWYFFYVCPRGKIRELIERWIELQEHKDVKEGIEYDRILRRLSLHIWASLVIQVILGMAMLITACFVEEIFDFMRLLVTPLQEGNPYIWYFIVPAFTFHTFWMMSALALMDVDLILFSRVIYEEFNLMSKRFESAINKNGDFVGDFEHYRLWHTKICKVTNALDDILRFPILVVCAVGFPMVCFYLYFFINYTESTGFTAITLYIACFHTTCLVLIMAVSVAWTHIPAHIPLELLCGLDTRKSPPSLAHQVTVFVSRLQGKPIGLTAMDLFTLDKPMILTIVGTLAAYLVVIFETRALKIDPACSMPLDEAVMGMFRNGTDFSCRQFI